ncbi:LysE family translocator [Sungkyunkwania multivorans]|uniref:LysE family translocator n=1 Tax=Sungkyunkwania multivorans TaxID=1173618 RepID=A0ABW3D1J2_9FLAO
MIENLQVAIPIGIFLAFTIGPVFFVLLETSAIKGFRAAITFDLGVIFADIIFIAIAFYSTSKIVEKVKDDPNLLVFGGVLLTTYGIISFIQNRKVQSFRRIVKEHYTLDFKRNYGQLFLKGFLLNFINIGVLAGWIGIIFVANSIEKTESGVWLFIFTVLATYLIVDVFKIMLAKKLKSKLTPRVIFKTKKLISLIILGFGVLLMVQGFFPKEKERLRERIEKINPLKD